MQTPIKTKIGLFVALPIYAAVILSTGIIVSLVWVAAKILNLAGILDAFIYLLQQTKSRLIKWKHEKEKPGFGKIRK